eukprot:759702-Hanusia_phi.AAC.2
MAQGGKPAGGQGKGWNALHKLSTQGAFCHDSWDQIHTAVRSGYYNEVDSLFSPKAKTSEKKARPQPAQMKRSLLTGVLKDESRRKLNDKEKHEEAYDEDFELLDFDFDLPKKQIAEVGTGGQGVGDEDAGARQHSYEEQLLSNSMLRGESTASPPRPHDSFQLGMGEDKAGSRVEERMEEEEQEQEQEPRSRTPPSSLPLPSALANHESPPPPSPPRQPPRARKSSNADRRPSLPNDQSRLANGDCPPPWIQRQVETKTRTGAGLMCEGGRGGRGGRGGGRGGAVTWRFSLRPATSFVCYLMVLKRLGGRRCGSQIKQRW